MNAWPPPGKSLTTDTEMLLAPPEDCPRCLLEEAASMGWPRVPLNAYVADESGADERARIPQNLWVSVAVGDRPLDRDPRRRVLSSATVQELHPELHRPTVVLRHRA